MRLQVNNSGAWKAVLTFSIADTEDVKAQAEKLGMLAANGAGEFISWRIVDSASTVVLHWDAAMGWNPPRWAQNYTWVP